MADTHDRGRHTPALVTERDAAERLSLAVSTLRRWRWAGRGPAYRKLGAAVRYHVDDLAAYLDASVRTSTSDDGSGARA